MGGHRPAQEAVIYLFERLNNWPELWERTP